MRDLYVAAQKDWGLIISYEIMDQGHSPSTGISNKDQSGVLNLLLQQ